MPTISDLRRRTLLRIVGALFACVCAFFLFYSGRLLYVTRGLQATRPGGQGAYVGAVVFPLLALGCAWVSWRAFTRAHREVGTMPPA
jgi:hypothetical protein